MSYAIVFSIYAFDTFELIREQVQVKWGSKFADDFEQRTLKILNTIQQSPFIYQTINGSETVHKAFLHKNCSMFYEVSTNKIEILFFWDNRQDPLFI